MEKIYGTKERQDGIMRTGRSKWTLFYGFGKDDDASESGWEYRHTFNHKPTLSEVKDLILSAINSETDQKIISGLAWQGMPVWLSTENQFNYKAAFDLAVQTNGESLPVKFKFGTDDNPIYYTFSTLEELKDFYITSLTHVQTVLDEGWQEKDNLDFSIFDLADE